MSFCPILIELIEGYISEKHNKSKFLLQVWNKDKIKVYEKYLKDLIGMWDICFNYFVYTLIEEGSNPPVYIVDLSNQNMTVIVRNLNFDSSDAKSGRGLTTKTINARIVALSIHVSEQQDQAFIFETPDNQIEIYKILLELDSNYQLMEPSFQQLREVAPREIIFRDKIKIFKFVIQNGNMFGCVLRESGALDLYQNWIIVESIDNCKLIFQYLIENITKISLSMDSFFFKKYDGSIITFDHNGNKQISFDSARLIEEKEFNFDQVFLKIIQNIVKLYSGFSIIYQKGIGTLLVITHSNYISVYNMLQQKWFYHYRYEIEIICLFTHFDGKNNLQQGILCQNGDIFMGQTDKKIVLDNGIIKKSNTVPGKIIKWHADIQFNQTLYILVQDKNEYIFYALVRNTLRKLDVLQRVDSQSNLLQIQSDDKQKFLLLQNKNEIILYAQTISQPDNTVLLDKKKIIQTKDILIVGQIHSGCSYDLNQYLIIFDQQNMHLIKINEDDIAVTSFMNVNCVGIYSFNAQFNYALCQDGTGSLFPGLRQFNMDAIVSRKQLKMNLLKKIDVGALGLFVHGSQISRIAFMNSITNIVICPILHQNTHKYFGIKNLPDYKLFNVLNGKFLAVLKDLIYTWDIYTAKYISKVPITEISLEKYDIIGTNTLGRVLFQSKQEIKAKQSFEDQFYFDWQLKSNINNSKTYQQGTKKSYREFIYAEIESSSQLRIHLKFIHYSQDGQ
ncbi:UNKNOWN [Stylonychia lemnae]|uniref:Uncharacterized protein n=1 Tax=Stylonychia lemnae TaxID=5949 RepID=A0A077ZRP5_STYLE|nr:UNKNOWN [Stylonychia lemnae]|eukprot:CDW72552.1 UNKNOWN [Stylonychia lemnae]